MRSSVGWLYFRLVAAQPGANKPLLRHFPKTATSMVYQSQYREIAIEATADAAPTNSGSAPILSAVDQLDAQSASSLPFSLPRLRELRQWVVAVDGGRIVVGGGRRRDRSTQDGKRHGAHPGSTSWAAEDGMAAADGTGRPGIGAAADLSGTTTVLGRRTPTLALWPWPSSLCLYRGRTQGQRSGLRSGQ